jgi:deoxyadenosine/deoxycytidine kinase
MILFEGNIAAGKSTVGRRLLESGLFLFVEQPVAAWQTDYSVNFLRQFYEDPKRWAFTFQLMAYSTRIQAWVQTLRMADHTAVVLERSIFSDRYVFAKNCYQSGLMSEAEWQVYCRMWDWHMSNWCETPDKIVYLRAPAEICHERLQMRGRKEEEKIPVEYLRDIEVLHDEWLFDNPLAVVVDGCKQWRAKEVYDLLQREGVALTSAEEAARSRQGKQ